MAISEEGQSTQKAKKPVSPIIILIIAFIFILWMMLLFTNKSVYDDYGMEISREWWVYIGSIVMIILICVLMVAGFPSRVKLQEMVSAQAETSSAGEGAAGEAPKGVVITEMKTVTATPVPVEAEIAVVEAEPIVVEAEIVEAEVVEEEEKEVKKDLKTKKPRLIEYPKKVPGGVYGDTIIRVDPRTKLNTRTLLVRSCMICDRQGKCWEEVQDTVPEDIFLENIECKKGLRKHKSAGGSSPG